jgi:hypothetical protein
VLDVVPLEVGQVTGVSLPCGGHAGRVTADRPPEEDQFLDGHLVVAMFAGISGSSDGLATSGIPA